jgi:hypothetical protein
VPVSILFAAVHFTLLQNPDHELAQFYPSVVGPSLAHDPSGAGPAFLDFFHTHYDAIDMIVRTRLVQKQVLKRSALLRMGLWAAGQQGDGVPIHLIEIGASGGVHLCFDRFHYALAGQTFGDEISPVTITTEWRSNGAPPDLDVLPVIASRMGIDLHALDVTNPEDRTWLRALVWPEEVEEAARLEQALEVVAQSPPSVLEGDVIDLASPVGSALPAGEPRLVFQFGTRVHVPADRLDAFDAAIQSFGDSGPLYVLSLTAAPTPLHDTMLTLQVPGQREIQYLVQADGYANWVARFGL